MVCTYTESNSDDQIVAWYSVYGESPEVHEASNVNQGEDNTD